MTKDKIKALAPTGLQPNGSILIERLLKLTDVMRSTAAYMLHLPDPAPQHAQELFGAARIVGQWIEEVEDDGK